MYDNLVKRLRERCYDCKFWDSADCMMEGKCTGKDDLEAADAIEALDKDTNVPSWIPIESRPMDEEERKEWSERIGYDIEYEKAISYTSKLPDDGEEVLVCNKYGHIWLDTFDNDPDYGVCFETNGDMDGLVAWMPKPKPYKPPKEE